MVLEYKNILERQEQIHLHRAVLVGETGTASSAVSRATGPGTVLMALVLAVTAAGTEERGALQVAIVPTEVDEVVLVDHVTLATSAANRVIGPRIALTVPAVAEEADTRGSRILRAHRTEASI